MNFCRSYLGNSSGDWRSDVRNLGSKCKFQLSVNSVIFMIEQNYFTVSICAPRGIHKKIFVQICWPSCFNFIWYLTAVAHIKYVNWSLVNVTCESWLQLNIKSSIVFFDELVAIIFTKFEIYFETDLNEYLFMSNKIANKVFRNNVFHT